ncbi:MAG: hypothetical protein KDD11_05970 [Acidobacteria bacterium]|nr:hypothetical protein [Acidobacteriota bacterium]
MSDKSKKPTELSLTNALTRRQDLDLVPHEPFGIQPSELKKRTARLFETRRQLVHTLRTERDSELRTILKERIARVREAEEHTRQLTRDLKSLEPVMVHQFELLRNGRHPQEALFRTAAAQEADESAQNDGSFKEADIFRSFEAFAWIFLKLFHRYRLLENEIVERDDKYRTAFTLFRRGVHPQQALIVELAAQRGFAPNTSGGEESYRMFISLAKEKRLLRQIQKGLNEESLKDLLKKARRTMKEAEEEAEDQRQLVSMIREELAASEQHRRLSDEELANLRQREAAHAESAERLENEARGARERAQHAEAKLSALKTDQAAKEKGLKRFRAEIRQRAEALRDEESKRLRKSEGGMYLDRDVGFLLLEARRTLAYQVERKERPSPSDPFLLMVVDELLIDDEFEERYLHTAGRELVGILNAYLLGEEPLTTVLTTLRTLDLPHQQLSPTPILRATGDRARDLLEAWLKPHRTFQQAQFQRYRSGVLPNRKELEELLLQHSLARTDLPSWIALWDQKPAHFTNSLDRKRKEEHK